MAVVAIAAAIAILAIIAARSGERAAPETVARVGGRAISLREVDEAWRRFDPGEYTRTQQMLHDGRRNALDRFIGDMLIEPAAAARGIPVEQYLANEMTGRTRPVTDKVVARRAERDAPTRSPFRVTQTGS